MDKISAPKVFNNLGDITQCGDDLIKSRLKETIKYWNKNQIFQHGGKFHGELTSDAESRVYKPFKRTINFPHGMVLPDGSHWGGSESIRITLKYTSHAQARMDFRCVSMEEVEDVIKKGLSDMADAWAAGNYSAYNDKFYHFFTGSDSENDGLKYDNVRVPIAVETVDPFYTLEINDSVEVKVLKGDTSYSLLTVIDHGVKRVRKSEFELREEKCKSLLENSGYTLVSKFAREKYAASNDISVTVVGANWIGGLRPNREQEMLVSVDLKGHEEEIQTYTQMTPSSRRDRSYLAPFRSALYDWIRENLLSEASKSSISSYKRNMDDFLSDGFSVTDHLGVTYNLKPNILMRRYLIEVPFKGEVVKTVNNPTNIGRNPSAHALLIIDSVEASPALEASFREKERQKEIEDCLKVVGLGYRVIDPQGRELKLASLRKQARLFGLLSTPMSNFEMKRFIDQLRWMFRKGQLDVVHHVDRTNTCHIIKLSAKGVTVEVKGFFVNQGEPGSNYKNIRVVVDGVPKRVSDPREAHDFIFQVFSELGLRR